jgi:hypothetical protein
MGAGRFYRRDGEGEGGMNGEKERERYSVEGLVFACTRVCLYFCACVCVCVYVRVCVRVCDG